MKIDRRSLIAGLSAAAFVPRGARAASIDFGNQGKLMNEIRALAASGHGVLFTTHDPNHALRAADRAYLLREGERIAVGNVRDILTQTNLEALYRAPVRALTEAKDGTNAFLPG